MIFLMVLVFKNNVYFEFLCLSNLMARELFDDESFNSINDSNHSDGFSFLLVRIRERE